LRRFEWGSSAHKQRLTFSVKRFLISACRSASNLAQTVLRVERAS
jgi:hypothetical protein